MPLPREAALVVIDVQKAIDHPGWGIRNNPGAERNIAALLGVRPQPSGPAPAILRKRFPARPRAVDLGRRDCVGNAAVGGDVAGTGPFAGHSQALPSQP